jgi:hypothetical protein
MMTEIAVQQAMCGSVRYVKQKPLWLSLVLPLPPNCMAQRRNDQ